MSDRKRDAHIDLNCEHVEPFKILPFHSIQMTIQAMENWCGLSQLFVWSTQVEWLFHSENHLAF